MSERASEDSGAGYVAKLIAALHHEEPQTPVRAAWILGERGEVSAVPALLEIADHGADPELLAAVAEALGKIADPRAIPTLARLARHSYLKARIAAVAALAKFDSPQAREAVLQAARDPNVLVRREASRALDQMRRIAARRGADPPAQD